MELPLSIKPAAKNKEEINHPDDYPLKEFFTHKNFTKKGAIDKFVSLIESKAGESQLDDFL